MQSENTSITELDTKVVEPDISMGDLVITPESRVKLKKNIAELQFKLKKTLWQEACSKTLQKRNRCKEKYQRMYQKLTGMMALEQRINEYLDGE